MTVSAGQPHPPVPVLPPDNAFETLCDVRSWRVSDLDSLVTNAKSDKI